MRKTPHAARPVAHSPFDELLAAALRVIGLSLIAGLFGGCSVEIEDPALVTGLRVLAVRAEPPEARPGETVALDALVADPLGEARTIDFAWGLCAPDPAAGICADASSASAFSVGTAATLVVPADALDRLSPEERAIGIDLFVFLSVSAGEESEIAFKRVRVSESGIANRNPELAGLLIAGIGVDPPPPDGETTLEALVDAGSAESYPDASGQNRTESLEVAWRVTAGRAGSASTPVDDSGCAETTWAADGDGPATIWAILRDDRGGVTWVTRQIGPSYDGSWRKGE